MSQGSKEDMKQFFFHHLHPQVKMGTASDRYAGWLRQIDTEERYQGRFRQRTISRTGKCSEYSGRLPSWTNPGSMNDRK